MTVNQIGMAAANNLRGLHPIAHVEDIGSAGTFLLDVREEAEVRHSPFAGATNIPLSQLRQRWSEVAYSYSVRPTPGLKG